MHHVMQLWQGRLRFTNKFSSQFKNFWEIIFKQNDMLDVDICCHICVYFNDTIPRNLEQIFPFNPNYEWNTFSEMAPQNTVLLQWMVCW